MITTSGQLAPNMGVVVGIRASRQVMPEWAIAMATQAWPINTNVCYVPIRCDNPKTGSKGPKRDQAAEIIVEGAQNLKAPYIWFIDDDVEVPYGTCRQLLQTLKEAPEDVMAVAGIYPAKRLPIEPVVYKTNGHGPFVKWKKDSIFPVSLVGMGCMMVKTEAFSKIEKPWFKDLDTDTLQMTDDGWFCGKLELAGLKVLADAHVLCTHWDNATETPYRFAEDSYPMLPAGKEHLFKSLPEGWMTIPELDWLSDRAAQYKQIVELGSFKGRSTVIMARSTAGMVWAVDDWHGPRNTARIGNEGRYVEYDADHTTLFNEFKENTSDLSNIQPVISDHAKAEVPIQPDMVFVDGDHEYDSVKRDILMWKQRLAPGGLLCGHDRDWEGVRRAIDELLPGWKPEAGSIWSCQC